MESEQAKRAGERVGPYRIERSIGHGGMGEVFQGFDERLDRAVALKRIKPDSADASSRKRFQREAQAIARLNHSAIVQVHDWVEDEDGAWIVMELVQGRSLRALLKEQLATDTQLPVETVLGLASDIAAGLAVAHDAGIVHRDLKPENVMVTESGAAKILDFGLAKRNPVHGQETSLTVEGKILGTFTAMSPEQAMGRDVDQRSDLFSMGTLIYEATTGVSPFQSGAPVETLTRICTLPQVPALELNPELPSSVSDLIDHLLSKDPARRPSNASEVKLRLDEMLSHYSGSRSMNLRASGLGATGLDETRQGDTGQGDTGQGDTGLKVPGGSSFLMMEAETQSVSGMTAPDTGRWVSPASSPELKTQSNDTLSYTGSWDPRLFQLMMLFLALAVGAGMVSFGGWRAPDPAANSAVDQALASTAPTNSSSANPSSKADLSEMDELQLYDLAIELLERYDKKDNIKLSIEALQRMLEKNPDSAPGHAGLAWAYLKYSLSESKDPDWLKKAEAIAERAIELDPFLARAKTSRGFIYQEMGRLDEAEKDLRAALDLNPGSVSAQIGLARVLRSQGELEAAEAVLSKAEQEHQESWTLHLELGGLYFRTGRYEEARACFEKVVRMVPDSVLGYRNLSGAHYFLGDLAKASSVLQRAIEIEPKSTLYSNLGTMLFAQGRYAQSVTAFERGISLAGGANDYRVWANLADAHRWTPGHEAKAVEAYGSALQLLADKLAGQPGDSLLGSHRVLYLAKKGECDSAMSGLRDLEQIPEIDAAVHYRCAVAYEICGARTRAISALRKALLAGYPASVVKSDPELSHLREDPEYHLLTAKI